MSNGHQTQSQLQILKQSFDAYGANTARWSHASQSVWDDLAQDPRAQVLMAEALAFDRLLDLQPKAQIPLPLTSRELALADRILAAAMSSPKAAPLLAPVAGPIPTPVLAYKRPAARVSRAVNRASYAALAACLMLGVLVGSSGLGRSAATYVADLAGLIEDDAEVAVSADFGPATDEVL